MLREETHIFVRGEAALWLEAFVQPQKAKRHLVLSWRERERGTEWGTKAEIKFAFYARGLPDTIS